MNLGTEKIPRWTIRKPILYLAVIVVALSLCVIVIIFANRGQLPTGRSATRQHTPIHNTSPAPARKTATTPTSHPSHDVSFLEIHVIHKPVAKGITALLTDPQGRTTGVQYGKDGSVVEVGTIPRSGTFGTGLVGVDDRYIGVVNPLGGDYELAVSGGVANTPYDLYVYTVSPDGFRPVYATLHGKTRADTVSSFRIKYRVVSRALSSLDVEENTATAPATLPE